MWGWVPFVGVGEEKSRLHMSGSQQAEELRAGESLELGCAGGISPARPRAAAPPGPDPNLEKSPSSFLLQNTNGLSKQGDHTQSGKIYEPVFFKP